MHTPTHGDYDIDSVPGIDKLRERIANAETPREWSFILKDYISGGNTKLNKNIAIFNMNSATDCPNADTDRCQVPWNECYAHKAEYTYGSPLSYRRRQEYLWDCMDADTFAAAFRSLNSRKPNPFKFIRFSEAGDFRHNGDVKQVDTIAKLLSPDITVYTYTASSHVDWNISRNFTVNASNEDIPEADRRYVFAPTDADIPDGAVQCSYEKAGIKCGDCRMCIDTKAPDVYITPH